MYVCMHAYECAWSDKGGDRLVRAVNFLWTGDAENEVEGVCLR
jgi:hypothetical protein